MSQEDVYNYIEKNPRCCSREIADGIRHNKYRISTIINLLLKHDEIKGYPPTIKEIEKIKRKYPNIKYSAHYKNTKKNCLKVFIVNDKRGASLIGYLFWIGLGFALGIWMCSTILKSFIC